MLKLNWHNKNQLPYNKQKKCDDKDGKDNVYDENDNFDNDDANDESNDDANNDDNDGDDNESNNDANDDDNISVLDIKTTLVS